jgi:hypothetical protein
VPLINASFCIFFASACSQGAEIRHFWRRGQNVFVEWQSNAQHVVECLKTGSFVCLSHLGCTLPETAIFYPIWATPFPAAPWLFGLIYATIRGIVLVVLWREFVPLAGSLQNNIGGDLDIIRSLGMGRCLLDRVRGGDTACRCNLRQPLCISSPTA